MYVEICQWVVESYTGYDWQWILKAGLLSDDSCTGDSDGDISDDSDNDGDATVSAYDAGQAANLLEAQCRLTAT